MINDLKVRLNTGKIDKLLDIIQQLPGNSGFKPVLDAIGSRIKSRIQLGFRNSTDPCGNAWHPIFHREGQPLIDTEDLKGSITYFADNNNVKIGTKKEYAPFHQFGTANIHTRPFMPVDQDGNADLPDNWERSVLDVINQHIKKATDMAN